MKTISIFCLIFLASFFQLSGQIVLPLSEGTSDFKPLLNRKEAKLQKELELELNKIPKWQKMIEQKRMSVGIIDLKNPELPRFASINGNHMMYAASLPKIGILLAAMDAFENGELMESPEIMNDLKLMITKSNNQASTRMIDLLGFDKIVCVLTDERYNLYEENYGGLWVGKRYASGGKIYRDPIKNLSHAATVNQVCRFYYMLAFGKLVNEERSKQMLNIMENPALHHKFVNTLDQIAPQARLFRKSGSWKTFHSDSILVWGKDPNRRYILVALVNDENGEQIIRKLVKPVEKVLKLGN